MALTEMSFSGWEPKKLWHATSAGARDRFEECAFAEGFDSRADGRSLIAADFDGDGRLDLLMLNRAAPKLQFFHNLGESGGSVELVLAPKSGHREADGVLVRTSRGISSAALARGYGSSVDSRVHLGLGRDPSVDVEVQWRSGGREPFPGLKAGATHVLTEGTGKATASIPFAARAARPAKVFPSTLASLGLERTPEPGSLTLVQLFLKGCKPCAEEAPALNRLAQDGAVRVLGLGLHPAGEALDAAAKALGITYPVAPLPDEIADGLSTDGQLPLPILLVYGVDGTLRRVLPGPKGLTEVLAELGVAPARAPASKPR